MNTTVLISLLDLEKCISSNSMLKKMAKIWVANYALQGSFSNSVYLKPSFLLWLHFWANSFGWILVVDVGGPPIHSCPKWNPLLLHPETSYKSVMATSWPSCANVA